MRQVAQRMAFKPGNLGDLVRALEPIIEEHGYSLNQIIKPRVLPAGTWAVTNLTVDRTYDANATSTAELADVLGTLIADLTAKGVLP